MDTSTGYGRCKSQQAGIIWEHLPAADRHVQHGRSDAPGIHCNYDREERLKKEDLLEAVLSLSETEKAEFAAAVYKYSAAALAIRPPAPGFGEVAGVRVSERL